MKTKEEFFNDEYTLVKTGEYKRLLKAEKHLASIREGKDYNWLQQEYQEIDSMIEDMAIVKFDLNEGDK